MGVDGEARELFVNQGNCALFFEPENEIQLVEQTLNLKSDKKLYETLSNNGKSFVKEHFDRQKLAYLFWNKIKTL